LIRFFPLIHSVAALHFANVILHVMDTLTHLFPVLPDGIHLLVHLGALHLAAAVIHIPLILGMHTVALISVPNGSGVSSGFR
jgi:hypothetical protein